MSMVEFLVYDLKVAGLVAVFYMFYRLLLSRETFHRVNRVVLLTTAVASFLLPLCIITVHRTVVVAGSPGGNVSLEGFGAVQDAPQTPLWQSLAVVLFFTGMAFTLGHMLLSILRVALLISRSQRQPQADGTVICLTDRDVSPFSWMHYIVLSRSETLLSQLGEEGRDLPLILAHERGHIRQHHTLDVLLVDTLTALQWFNPAMWMLRQDLRAIHEYEADAAVLSHGISMRQYQYLLIQKAVGDCGYSVVNGITHSTLKNRINMMLHKKSNRASLLKLLALVPIVGTVLALQGRTVTDYVYSQPQKKVVMKKGHKAGQVKLSGQTIEVKADTATSRGENVNVGLDKNRIETKTAPHSDLGEVNVQTYKDDKADEKGFAKVFDVVEQMPMFPGGYEALMKFLSENVRYPEAALKTGAQGRVIVNFIVESDGRISNVRVIKKASDDLDAEAIRLVGSMPKWEPGKQNGEAVRVKFTMPVTFKLD